ncbi:MAG: hypothetical protein ISR82_08515 [Candidatus Marinimicrobia bacterium]|nr:hypothetical protein [Candidatus Neomarinimicrobiota bacterium]MBL7011250.1 hypothetical protein [Candidatus Neomarinimicrobiota bacterium]MBL7031478.1 hypothetical protein [Candidatus Neomarinimicrobiota bacterium]
MMRLKNITYNYISKNKYRFLLIVFLSFSFHTDIFAQGVLYPGEIFSVKEREDDFKGALKLSILKDEKNKGLIRLNDQTGKPYIYSTADIDANEIRDMKIGDVDNDGEDEIAIITKLHLYIMEKVGNKFVIDENKTTPLYGPERKGNPNVLSPQIELQDSRPLPEEKREGGRIAIGDVTNDGKNEIVLTRTFMTPFEFQTIVPAYICINDILQWKDGYFEVIDAISAGNYKCGIFIEDVDQDGLNELIIGGNTISIFKSVTQYDEIVEWDPKRWWGRAFNKGYKILGIINVGANAGHIKLAVEKHDGKLLMSYCVQWDIGPEFITKNIGKIKTIELDPRVINEGGVESGKFKRYNITEFKEIGKPIQLPVTTYKNDRIPYVNLKSLVVGKINDTGQLEIIANMEKEALLLKIERK